MYGVSRPCSPGQAETSGKGGCGETVNILLAFQVLGLHGDTVTSTLTSPTVKGKNTALGLAEVREPGFRSSLLFPMHFRGRLDGT